MGVVFSIERVGEFPVRFTHSNKYQCGNQGQPILQFKVKIQGEQHDLNNDGWLIDNNAIPNYFRRTYGKVKDFKSCEHIAEKACSDFAGLVRHFGGRARRVKVAVSGIPGSWITCEWRDSDFTFNSLGTA